MPADRVLLLSSRAATPPFFEALARRPAPVAGRPLAFTLVPADPDALARHAADVDGAAVAVVDVYPTPPAALGVCRALQARRPDLPVLALLCCPRAAGPRALRALREAGVSLSGAHATARQLVADIESVARGEDVLSVHTIPRPSGGGPAVLPVGGLAAGVRGTVGLQSVTEADRRLLELVADGLTDNQIGARLGQSPRTVQRHVADLSLAVGARSRAHLAAWATAAGLYRFVPVATDSPTGDGDRDERRGA